MKRWTAVFLIFALVGGLGVAAYFRLGKKAHPAAGHGRFVAIDHAGTLTGSGSPPKEAKIEESGGKVRVTVRDKEISGGGMQIGIDGGAEFDAESDWFVAFDGNDVLHYGIYPKWVNRIDRKSAGYAVRGLAGRDRDEAFAEVARILGW